MLQIITATTKPPTSTTTPPLFYHNPSAWWMVSHRLAAGYQGEVHQLRDKLTPEREQKKQSKFHRCCPLCYSICSRVFNKNKIVIR